MPVLEPGTQLKRGTFEIVSLLGQGGFGEVYLARQSRVDRDVAIKVLLPHVSANEDMVTRFQREALAAANLLHPNVLTVFDFDFEEPLGVWFLALQYVPGGRTLRNIMTGPIAVSETARYIEAIGSALDAAHSRGITHRDVKPENVLLHGERPLLTDFGIAHLGTMSGMTATGMAIGTPAYMSPEQALGRPIGPGSDQYALAVIAYEMLAGRPPFLGDPVSLMVQHANATPPPLASLNSSVSAAARAAVLLALSKNPSERFTSCTEFARAILTASLGASTSSASPIARSPVDLLAPTAEATAVGPSAAPDTATPDVPFSYKFPDLTAARPAADEPLDAEPAPDRHSSETAIRAVTPPLSAALPAQVDSAQPSSPVPELEDAALDAPPEPLSESPETMVRSTDSSAETVWTRTPESLETVLRTPDQPSGSATSSPPPDAAAPPTEMRPAGADEPPTAAAANQTPDFMPAINPASGAASAVPPESPPTVVRQDESSTGGGVAAAAAATVLQPPSAAPESGSRESAPTVFRPTGPATPTPPLEPPTATPPPAVREPSGTPASQTPLAPGTVPERPLAPTTPGMPPARAPEPPRKSGAPVPLLAGIAAAVVLVLGLAIFAVTRAPTPGPQPDGTPGVAIRPTTPANPTTGPTSGPGATAAPPAPVGSIRVASSPDGAAITVNGEPAGRTPRLINNLPPGSYEVVLSSPSYRDFTQTVEVEENQQLQVNGELSPRPPIEVLEVVEQRIGKDPYIDPSNLIRLGSFTDSFSRSDGINAIVYLKPSSFNIRGLTFTTTNRWQRAGASPIELHGDHQVPKEWDQTFLRACAPALALDALGSGAPLGLEILIDGEVAARFSFRIAGGNPANAAPSPCDTSAIPRTMVDRGRLAPPVALAR
jgi:serine/threonine-protein kinase